MKIISWNVNGIRAVCKKGFLKWFNKAKPDIVCLQEIKANQDQVPDELQKIGDWFRYFNPALRPGYAGTAVFAKQKPVKAAKAIGFKKFDQEGRIIQLDFEDFVLINLYLPHGGRGKENLKYKLEVYDHLIKYLEKIKKKPIILLGDFNIAHQEIDLARPKHNQNNIMFTIEERKQIDRIIDLGFVDSFRKFDKEPGNYTWWPYFRNARQRNLGWRIDYVFASKPLAGKLKTAFILPKVMGSDHCPAGADIRA